MKRWQDIPGWFNFERVYDLAPVFLRNNKLKFLEIGSFLGKSTMYMYEKLKEPFRHGSSWFIIKP